MFSVELPVASSRFTAAAQPVAPRTLYVTLQTLQSFSTVSRVVIRWVCLSSIAGGSGKNGKRLESTSTVSLTHQALSSIRRLAQSPRGGVELKVYRCARSSTSLESFHLHINHFIPGRFHYLCKHLQQISRILTQEHYLILKNLKGIARALRLVSFSGIPACS